MAGLILDSVRPRESGAQVWILASRGNERSFDGPFGASEAPRLCLRL